MQLFKTKHVKVTVQKATPKETIVALLQLALVVLLIWRHRYRVSQK